MDLTPTGAPQWTAVSLEIGAPLFGPAWESLITTFRVPALSAPLAMGIGIRGARRRPCRCRRRPRATA